MINNQKKGFYQKYIKIPQDVSIAVVLLIALSPILFVVALLVRIKLGRPIIFKQERAGKEGKPYYMYKFRSMSNEYDINGDILPDEQRLQKFGKLLRSTSLDELPSLWNVIRCEISLVGPRSLYVHYNGLYNEQQARRLEVRPGITGLAQINGRNTLGWEERFLYDVQYVDNVTFVGDWKIMFKTIGKVIKREGITSSTSVTMEEFKGNQLEVITHE